MPNHVTNIITAPKHIIDSLKGEEAVVDFNTVIPEPEGMLTGGISHDEMQANPNNWYTFHSEKWGTKWNAYDIERLSDEQVQFDTAWAHPFPVLQALSKKFGNEIITVKFADEDLGRNLGEYRIINGMVSWVHEEGQMDVDERNEFAAQIKYGQSYAEVTADWED